MREHQAASDKAAKPNMHQTGLSPGGDAAGFANFDNGSRLVWSKSRPATEQAVRLLSAVWVHRHALSKKEWDK